MLSNFSEGSTNVTDYEFEEEETQDKYAESDGGDMDVDEGGSGYENTQGEDSCEDSSNLVSDDGDEDNDEAGMEESVSAKNLRLGQDGKLVLWTRFGFICDNDKKIFLPFHKLLISI